ncbi:2,4-dienoyl-CoA reductase-like NADH-dependent reductase (Old Yellow Enzyme family) [Povalibacter uvarum]|uniref:2,4-dienoyl-CoA reductase-like NADH-dependent reductase (Old Yellow Enzyme family) n=1 Tax=Povalibacter uvarum TaxID=732238 RepID=A0A841HFV5_9GAMM|nr:NADH:flavin oxidoreductase [Povalibacter uvarum]MBB6091991.1 2,4-dienoyl-CoA reductase-like NADH-dependent reductase (Old Yellow Enzyme family) [Povalibacter uvarum]
MEAVDSPLFRPVSIGKLTLPGRLIKTATAETRASHDGFVTPELLQFYIPIAQGGTPLIITGNIYVCRAGKSAPRQLGADDDDKIPGLKQLTDAVHAHGARMFAQINHCGRQVVPDFAGLTEAVSASAVKELVTGTLPRELSLSEIERVIANYASAAWRCKQAGFDGVQIHAANGYLMSQFLTPHTNRRTDRYGGSFDQRLSMLRDVFRAIRARVGPDFPIILKMNGSDDLPLRHGLKTPDLVRIAEAMAAEGVDAVEISVGHYESGMPMVHGTFGRCLRNMTQGGMRYLPFVRRWGFRIFWPVLALLFDLLWPRREGFNLAYARQFRRKLSIPVICVGGFRTRASMEAAISDQGCDIVSAGRPFLADPLFYRHIQRNEPGPRCLDCNACIGHLGAQPADCYHPTVRAQKDAMLARLL